MSETIMRRSLEQLRDLLRPNHEPQWEGSVVRYANKYLAKYAWGVGREMDLDDLMQDAYLLFMKISDRYDVKSPEHFMQLWKRSLRNWMVNLGKARIKRREVRIRQKMRLQSRDMGETDVSWMLHLQEAPLEVRCLIESVDRLREQRVSYHHRLRSDGRRETTNAYLCRLACIDPNVPLRRLFEQWIGA